jgi:tight adherence protein B
MEIMIGVCAFVAMALLAAAAGRRLSARRRRLHERMAWIAGSEPITAAGSPRLLRNQNYSRLPVLQHLLRRSPRAERIADDLDRAGLTIRVGEYLSLCALAGLILAVISRLLMPEGIAGVVLMVLAFAVGACILPLYVRRRIRRRRQQFENDLPDALDIIGRGLITGSGLLAAIDAVCDQMQGVIAAEFGRLRQEIAVGLSIETAFRGLDQRLQSKDVHIVVTAILIQREVGGNLAEIMENVAGTMRERVSLRNEMKSLTGRQHLTAYIVSLVPIFVIVAFILLQPETMRQAFTETIGRVMLLSVLALIAAGFLTIRMLVASFEV